MPNHRKVDAFQKKAARAQARGKAAKDTQLRETWLALARKYRDLAETALAPRHRVTKAHQQAKAD
jgi:hypothetical protein